MAQGLQQETVFFSGANRHADVFLTQPPEVRAVADEDAHCLKFPPQAGGPNRRMLDSHEEEVRFCRVRIKPAKRRKTRGQIPAFPGNEFERLLPESGVHQRFCRRNHRQGIHRPRFLLTGKFLDQARVGNEVPESQAWKCEEFREGAQHNKMTVFTGPPGKRGLRGEIDKRLINNKLNSPSQADIDNGGQCFRGDHHASRIIGIGEDKHVGRFSFKGAEEFIQLDLEKPLGFEPVFTDAAA